MKHPIAKPNFLGLRTEIYHAPDLAKAKAWYSSVLGFPPYFDQPFYVGFKSPAPSSASLPIQYPDRPG
jgi:catechol 2,3-dioxygenase-like lactoylglutathione lyase family enzyme